MSHVQFCTVATEDRFYYLEFLKACMPAGANSLRSAEFVLSHSFCRHPHTKGYYSNIPCTHPARGETMLLSRITFKNVKDWLKGASPRVW
jgi:hypothetical protein